MKERYIDIMEKAVSAYTIAQIEEYIASVRKDGLAEHGFPRMAANIGILLAHGRAAHLRDLFVQIMDLCAQEMPVALHKYNSPRVGNEFTVREITLCLLELEKAQTFPAEQIAQWKAAMASFDPWEVYSEIAPFPPKAMGNWAAFAGLSEQARIYAGLADNQFFVNNQIASQLFSFDENGMYRDPNEPMVYEIATRYLLAFTLFLGYDGEHRATVEDLLNKASNHTPYFQSVTGELAFGGRSNQMVGTESHFAGLFEFEARMHKKNGDMARAGACKRAAQLALDSIERHYAIDHMYHVKNRYPLDSGFGCEGYAYFNKYMVTTASFLYLAYLLADDTIEPLPCLAETGRYVHSTSEYFHKTFLKFGDYYLEYDTNADFHYDATGLGRVHKKDAPSVICLSVPAPPTPASYKVDIANPGPMSICGGMMKEGKPLFSCERGTKYTLAWQEVTDEYAAVAWDITLQDGTALRETCYVREDGVTLRYEGDGEIVAMLPAFQWDGYEGAEISCDGNTASVRYAGSVCRYTSDAPLTLTDALYANRNGHYRTLHAQANNTVTVHITIE